MTDEAYIPKLFIFFASQCHMELIFQNGAFHTFGSNEWTSTTRQHLEVSQMVSTTKYHVDQPRVWAPCFLVFSG